MCNYKLSQAKKCEARFCDFVILVILWYWRFSDLAILAILILQIMVQLKNLKVYVNKIYFRSQGSIEKFLKYLQRDLRLVSWGNMTRIANHQPTLTQQSSTWTIALNTWRKFASVWLIPGSFSFRD